MSAPRDWPRKAAEVFARRKATNGNGFPITAALTAQKRPYGKNWRADALRTPSLWAEIPPIAAAASTGIVTGHVVGVDIDVLVLAARNELGRLSRFEFGVTPLLREGLAPKILAVYGCDNPFNKLTTGAFRMPDGTIAKVEILAAGQQFIYDGLHPDTQKPYRWLNGKSPETVKLKDLPVITLADAQRFIEQAKAILLKHGGVAVREPGAGTNGTEPHTPNENLRAAALDIGIALSKIPNDGPPDWDWWNDRGMAVYGASGGSDEGFELWDEWSRRNESYSAEITLKRWENYHKSPPTRIGMGSLHHWAKEAEAKKAEQEEAARKKAAPQPAQASWPILDPKALYGLPGQIVRTLAPHTEADPAALLIHLLTGFGNAIGRIPYYRVNRSRHYTNLYALVVGETSRARKGLGADDIMAFLRIADPNWSLYRVRSGLSSGEGLTFQVRDARIGWDKQKQEDKIIDNGAKDKRLLILETEWGSALTAMGREGNRLSANMRNGWDGKPLEDMVKNNPLRATEHLISILGHITEHELKALLALSSIYNGFANRFLYILSRRAHLLPFGGSLSDQVIDGFGQRIQQALYFAQQTGEVVMDDPAKALWETLYRGDWDTPVPGLLDDVIQRAPPQTVRLATIYALFDRSPVIRLPHLEAALAVWDYNRQSAARIFGDLTGNPVADEMLRVLRRVGVAGLSRTEIWDELGHGTPSGRITTALELLERQRQIRREEIATGGRKSERWFIC